MFEGETRNIQYSNSSNELHSTSGLCRWRFNTHTGCGLFARLTKGWIIVRIVFECIQNRFEYRFGTSFMEIQLSITGRMVVVRKATLSSECTGFMYQIIWYCLRRIMARQGTWFGAYVESFGTFCEIEYYDETCQAWRPVRCLRLSKLSQLLKLL